MPDTLAFLQLLRQLDSPQAEEQQRDSGGGSSSSDSGTAGAAPSAAEAAGGDAAAAEASAELELPEFRAARGLFRCAFCLRLAFAARCDVWHGGWLVLQMLGTVHVISDHVLYTLPPDVCAAHHGWQQARSDACTGPA
jgi:hypothetical protein